MEPVTEGPETDLVGPISSHTNITAADLNLDWNQLELLLGDYCAGAVGGESQMQIPDQHLRFLNELEFPFAE